MFYDLSLKSYAKRMAKSASVRYGDRRARELVVLNKLFVVFFGIDIVSGKRSIAEVNDVNIRTILFNELLALVL